MSQKTLLWLDDARNPLENDWLNFSPIGKVDIDVMWVKNYKQFCNYINANGLPEAICFDHDLGEEKTGYDCAKYLVDYCMDNNLSLPLYNIHSANPVGKENIKSLLENYKKYFENETR